MRILMINSVCGIGSTGRICTDLADALESRGHEVKIAYGRGNVPEAFRKDAIRIGNLVDMCIHGIKARIWDAAGWGSKRATKEFVEWIKKYNPDVIHLHNLHGYYVNVEILFEYLRTCNKKIIWTLHDCWSFTGHSALCDMIGCKKWEIGCEKCPQLCEYPKSFWDGSKRNYQLKKDLFSGIPQLEIVTPSEWLAGQVRLSFLSEYKVTVINNGIDTSMFCATDGKFRKDNNLEDAFIILGVSSIWNNMKGFEDYIKLSSMLPPKFRIVLVGVTKKQKKKLPRNMVGIERISNQKELAEIYTTADCFLNLTYCDTYPTVNLEALACGTPVITYATGGSTESAGQSAVILGKGDIHAVEEFLRDKRKLEKVKSVVKSSKEMLNDYLTIYTKHENLF